MCDDSDVDDRAFWELISRLDWAHTGEDDPVVEPVIRALASLPPDEIVASQEILANRLYALDGRRWARESGSGIW